MAKKTVKKRREICILGYAAETRDRIFHLSDDVEIYGINMVNVFLGGKKKASRWFQLHPRDWSTAGKQPTGYWGRPKEHFDFLKAFEGDVYMSYQDDDIPNCKVFSIEDTLAELRKNGNKARHYFTSTFAYIMAQVITEKPDKIYLYGINLTALDEYTKQRNCMEYWIAQAEARGIEVEIPSESALCKAPDYGLGATSPQEELEAHFYDRIQKIKDSYMEAAFNVNTAQSMRTETKHWVDKANGIAEAVVGKIAEAIESSEDKDSLVAKMEDIGSQAKATIQQLFTERDTSLAGLSDKSTADLNGFMGQLKEAQHTNGFLGIIDVRAPALPAMRFPSPELAKDIKKPKEMVV